MSVLYVEEQGAYIKKCDERLVIEVNRVAIRDVPLVNVEQIVCFGNVQVTSQTLALLLEQNVDLCFLTAHGKFRGRLVGETARNGRLRQAQWRVSCDPVAERELAARFVIGKIRNQRALLRRHARQYEGSQVALKAAADTLTDALRAIPRAQNLDWLRGLEGDAASVYFGAFGLLLRQSKFAFHSRERRPPRDPVNALLSFTYTLVANELLSAIHVVGLDPYVGFLHAERHGKASLCFDVIEEFRAPFADALVLSVINNRVLTPDDFDTTLDVCTLREAGKRRFLEQYEQKKQDVLRHPVFKYQATYKRCFELQVRLLAKTLIGEIPEYIPFMPRG